MGQGYLYSRPCSMEDATRLLSLFAQKPTVPEDDQAERRTA